MVLMQRSCIPFVPLRVAMPRRVGYLRVHVRHYLALALSGYTLYVRHYLVVHYHARTCSVGIVPTRLSPCRLVYHIQAEGVADG